MRQKNFFFVILMATVTALAYNTTNIKTAYAQACPGGFTAKNGICTDKAGRTYKDGHLYNKKGKEMKGALTRAYLQKVDKELKSARAGTVMPTAAATVVSARSATTQSRPSVNTESAPQSETQVISGGIRFISCNQGCFLKTDNEDLLVHPYTCVDTQGGDCGAAVPTSDAESGFTDFIISEMVLEQI